MGFGQRSKDQGATNGSYSDKNSKRGNFREASYQSGLLEAMLVEQECREGSSSPMETSAIASNKAEEKGEEEQQQSCGDRDDSIWLNTRSAD
ncbi:hypothetical protein RHMOL_Rhmol11G0067200 [Rhododendron molle]|uniref:Uncharacterized protein n=1 Tax=Rhododendron molle TaxID=49168 RepID=A0ACC0LPI3_RHOML|nr:hypothetical protein RHMOL_Rhmol11G0067200 [Rhododendron molle]